MSKPFEVFNTEDEKEYMVRNSLAEDVVRFVAFIEQQNEKHESFVRSFKENFSTGEVPLFRGRMDDFEGWVDRSVANVHEDEEDLVKFFTDDYSNYLYKSQLLMLWALQEESFAAITSRLAEIREVEKLPLKRINAKIKRIKKIEDCNSKQYKALIEKVNNFHSISTLRQFRAIEYEIYLLHGCFSEHEMSETLRADIAFLLDVNTIRNKIAHNDSLSQKIVNKVNGVESNGKRFKLSSVFITEVWMALIRISG